MKVKLWPASKAAVSGIPYLFGGLDSVSLGFHLCIWEAMLCGWTPHTFVCPLPAFTWSCGDKIQCHSAQCSSNSFLYFFSLSLGKWTVFLCITTKGIFFTLFSQKCLLSLLASGKLEANAFSSSGAGCRDRVLFVMAGMEPAMVESTISHQRLLTLNM